MVSTIRIVNISQFKRIFFFTNESTIEHQVKRQIVVIEHTSVVGTTRIVNSSKIFKDHIQYIKFH